MIRKLSTWLAVALAGGAFVAGCGSSSSTTSSSQGTSTPAGAASTPATTSPAGTTSTPARTTPTGATAGTANPPSAAQAVATCKRSIEAQPTISPSAKIKLEGICSKASSGDRTALHKVAEEVCLELVKASQVPAGVSRERALAVCRAK